MKCPFTVDFDEDSKKATVKVGNDEAVVGLDARGTVCSWSAGVAELLVVPRGEARQAAEDLAREIAEMIRGAARAHEALDQARAMLEEAAAG